MSRKKIGPEGLIEEAEAAVETNAEEVKEAEALAQGESEEAEPLSEAEAEEDITDDDSEEEYEEENDSDDEEYEEEYEIADDDESDIAVEVDNEELEELNKSEAAQEDIEEEEDTDDEIEEAEAETETETESHIDDDKPYVKVKVRAKTKDRSDEKAADKKKASVRAKGKFKPLSFYDINGKRKAEKDLNPVEMMLRDAHIRHIPIKGTVVSAEADSGLGAYALISVEKDNTYECVYIKAADMGIGYADMLELERRRYANAHNGREDERTIYRMADRRAKKRISNMLGTQILFVIDGGEGGIIVGNRSKIQIKRRRKYCFPEDGVAPRLKVGKTYKVPISMVTSSAIHVDLFGYEIKLEAKDISADFIYNLKERYHAGDHIMLIVTDIQGYDEVDTSTTKKFARTSDNLKITVTTYEALHRNKIIEKNLKRYKRGAVVMGEVSFTGPSGICNVKLRNGCVGTCFTTNIRPTPIKGDRVKFYVDHLDEDTRTLRGQIIDFC